MQCSLCSSPTSYTSIVDNCSHRYCSSHLRVLLFAHDEELFSGCPLCSNFQHSVNDLKESLIQKHSELDQQIQQTSIILSDLFVKQKLSISVLDLLTCLPEHSSTPPSTLSSILSEQDPSLVLSSLIDYFNDVDLTTLSADSLSEIQSFLSSFNSPLSYFHDFLEILIPLSLTFPSFLSFLISFISQILDSIVIDDLKHANHVINHFPSILTHVSDLINSKNNSAFEEAADWFYFLSLLINTFNSKSNKQIRSKFRFAVISGLNSEIFVKILTNVIEISVSPEQNFDEIFNLLKNTLIVFWPLTLHEFLVQKLSTLQFINYFTQLLSKISTKISDQNLLILEPLTISLGYLTRLESVKKFLSQTTPINSFTVILNVVKTLHDTITGHNHDFNFDRITSCISKLAGILWNFSSDTYNREFIGSLGGDALSPLMSLLTDLINQTQSKSTQSAIVIENIVGFLWNIAVFPNNKYLLTSIGIFPILSSLLSLPIDSIRHNVTGCLWVLSSDGQVREYLHKEGAVDLLKNLIEILKNVRSQSTVTALEHVAGSLRNLSLHDGLKRTFIHIEDSLSTLITILSDCHQSDSVNSNLIDKILSVIWIISSISEISSSIKSKELLNILLSFCDVKISANILEKILGILRNLSVHANIRVIFGQTNVSKILTEILATCCHVTNDTSSGQNSSDSLCDLICSVVANLSRDVSLRISFLSTDILNYLITHITSGAINSSLAENVISSIQSLLTAEDESLSHLISPSLLSLVLSALLSMLGCTDSPRFVIENSLTAIISAVRYSSKTLGLRSSNVEILSSLLFNKQDPYWPCLAALLKSEHEHVVRDTCRLIQFLSTDENLVEILASDDILFELVDLSGCDSHVIRRIASSVLTVLSKNQILKQKIIKFVNDVQSPKE
ncbi:hypothetical protein RCL1_002863 [Eukaryota sp. TZLM3-RCL]